MTKAANLSVSYLHTSGYDQFDTNNVNTPLPGTCDTLTQPDLRAKCCVAAQRNS